MIEWIIFALIGVLSGLLSGLLGLGGGIIIVPALLLVFNWQGLSEQHLMHMAVATSLMTIIFTSSTSAYAHHKRGNVDWKLVRSLTPGLVIGSILGAFLATMLASKLLQQCFAVYALFAAIKIWLPSPLLWHQQLLNTVVIRSFSGIVGTISALVGIGGGTLIVPYLLMARQPIQRAIGTSATCGLPISIAAVLGFLAMEHVHNLNTTMGQTSFIHWPAFLGIVSTSSLFVLAGVKLASVLPVVILRQLFSGVLVLGAVYLFVN